MTEMKDKMNYYVKKAYDDISSFLMEDHKDMHIDVILFDEKTKATYTIASDGNDQCFSFDPYTKYEPNGYQIIPEWDFNFDYYLYDLLEQGCQIGYMTNDMHYGVWNSINELYPNDIEFSDGVIKYIEYCKNNGIDKNYLDIQTNLETPDIMPLFDKTNIRVLYVEPNKLPEVKIIKNELEELQKTVSYGEEGLIEMVYLPRDNDVILVCNEEGKINNMGANRDIGYDIIYGPFFIAADDKDSGEFKSLSDEQILKYKMRFDKHSIIETENKLTALKLHSMKQLNEDFNR